VLVPVSNYHALYPLEAALRRAHRREAEIVVLHIQLLGRAGSGESELAPDQLFSPIEQLLFTRVLAMAEKEGKPVRLACGCGQRSLGRHPPRGGELTIEQRGCGELVEDASH
jgi:hypothetical protein